MFFILLIRLLFLDILLATFVQCFSPNSLICMMFSVHVVECICKASQKSTEIPRNIPSYFTPAKNAKFTNGNNNKLLDLDQLVIDDRLLGKKFFGIFSLNR